MSPITRYALWGILIIMIFAIAYQCSSQESGGGGVYYSPGYRGGSYRPGSSGGSYNPGSSGSSFRGGGPGGGK